MVRMVRSLADRTFQPRSGVTEMHTAALKGDLQTLADALQKGASPNSRCVRNVTPLHLACKGGHLAAVQLLVKHGAEVRCDTDMKLNCLGANEI